MSNLFFSRSTWELWHSVNNKYIIAKNSDENIIFLSEFFLVTSKICLSLIFSIWFHCPKLKNN